VAAALAAAPSAAAQAPSPTPTPSPAPSPSPSPAPAPQTGFEARLAETPVASAGVGWTTLEEEAAFLEEIDAASERVAVDVVGSSAQGRPLRLVRIGAPAPADLAAAAEGRVVLFTCLQHGDEPAGREGCLQSIRTLAFSQDPRVVEHLATTSVLYLPTVNPDGRVADERRNAQGIDINRDHLVPDTPEAALIQTLIRDLRPDVVADMHEFGSRPLYDTELLYLWPRNRNVDPAIHRLSRTLGRAYVRRGAEAAGFSTGVYGISVLEGQSIAQDAGNEDARILRNQVGLRHAVGLLVETDTEPNRRNPEEAGNPVAVQARRVATQVRANDDVLRFHRDRAAEVEATTEEAFARATAEGASRAEPFYLAGADNDLPSIRDVLLPPPCAYDLTAAQAQRLAGVFAIQGIVTEDRGADVRVSMAQPAQPRIPLLLDPDAPFSVVNARRVNEC